MPIFAMCWQSEKKDDMINNLIFDLDGTLYPYSQAVEANVDQKIKEFFCRRLNLTMPQVEKLMSDVRSQGKYEADIVESEFGISISEFIEDICDVYVGMLEPNPQLAEILSRLPQHKFIFTDSTQKHVADVLNQVCVPANLFDKVIDTGSIGYQFKYDNGSFNKFFALTGIKPEESIIFEDSRINIKNAKAAGLSTVLIAPADSAACAAADYRFADITTALSSLF